MENGSIQHVAEPLSTGNTSESPAILNGIELVSPASQPAVRYASDAEVDLAMEKIFTKHDKLFKELAK